MRVVAENLANADSTAKTAGADPYRRQAPVFQPVTGTDSETTLDGNKVVLEDQMAKMTEARMDYEAAIGFYQKSLEMLRMAARPPGK